VASVPRYYAVQQVVRISGNYAAQPTDAASQGSLVSESNSKNAPDAYAFCGKRGQLWFKEKRSPGGSS
jgi:hypothetical protein